MNRSEWLQIVADVIDARWPRHELPKPSIALYLTELGHLSGDQVTAAIIAIDRGGDQKYTPPTAGQILAKVIDLATDMPSWPRVRKTLLAAYGYPEKVWHNGGEHFPRAARLEREPEQVQRFADLVGWDEISVLLDPNDRTAEAQLRQKWDALVAGDKGDMALVGLPSAGLKRLERVNSAPRQIGSAITALLEAGKGTTP